MNRDTEIWTFMLKGKRFFRFSEIKKALNLHDAQLTKSLRRLERQGLIVKDIFVHVNRPFNEYLAINPSGPELKVRVVDIKEWYLATIEITDENNVTRSFSVDLGELSNYIHSVNGKLYLKWPEWISGLAGTGKVSFEEWIFPS